MLQNMAEDYNGLVSSHKLSREKVPGYFSDRIPLHARPRPGPGLDCDKNKVSRRGRLREAFGGGHSSREALQQVTKSTW